MSHLPRSTIKLSVQELRLQQAAVWHRRNLEGTMTEADQGEFEKWLMEDKANLLIYQKCGKLQNRLDQLFHDPNFQDQLSASTDICQEIPIRRRRLRLPRLQSSCFHRPLALSLIALLALLLLAAPKEVSMPVTYQSIVGEQKIVLLEDGSELTLNTDSRVSVKYQDQSRYISLQKGQVYFKVAKDQKRPFVVTFPTGRVTALGTEFDISLKNKQAIVRLLEGKVKVEPEVSLSKSLAKVTPVYLEADRKSDRATEITLSDKHPSAAVPIPRRGASEWRSGKIIFENQKLKEVLEEINRYSARRFELAAPEIGERRISGILPTSATEAIQILCEFQGLKLTDDGSYLIPAKASKLN
ncbi:FecR family protein [Emcibacter nanhaiensis]|nr:FecR domain-containing protein [Emcibacter nanhaiensis]